MHNHRVGVTAKQFEQMQGRVAGTRRPAPVAPLSLTSRRDHDLVIIGVDPSLRGTGYGIIRLARPHPVAVLHDTIRCPAAWPASRCLALIAQTLRGVLKQHRPTVAVVEGLFFAQNLKTALIMGEARGAALVALAEAGLEIYELATRKVKQAIVGYGAAQKIAVARMVQRRLCLAELPSPDAADALALALAHAQEINRYSLHAPKRI